MNFYEAPALGRGCVATAVFVSTPLIPRKPNTRKARDLPWLKGIEAGWRGCFRNVAGTSRAKHFLEPFSYDAGFLRFLWFDLQKGYSVWG